MADGQGNGTYYVDIVMCIDATGSMNPILDEVKGNAMDFYQKFVDGMQEANKDVEQVRIKVIAFRDYKKDSEPVKESEFFMLPAQNEAFRDFVKGINADGGGDAPESALEAIALALKSDWTTEGDKQRHCILVFTDAPAHPLGTGSDASTYPQGMPKDLAELGSWWEGDQGLDSNYRPKAGRLVAFVPNAEPWTSLESWNRYWPAFSKAGTGLSEVDIQAAVDLLVGSC